MIDGQVYCFAAGGYLQNIMVYRYTIVSAYKYLADEPSLKKIFVSRHDKKFEI